MPFHNIRRLTKIVAVFILTDSICDLSEFKNNVFIKP